MQALRIFFELNIVEQYWCASVSEFISEHRSTKTRTQSKLTSSCTMENYHVFGLKSMNPRQTKMHESIGNQWNHVHYLMVRGIYLENPPLNNICCYSSCVLVRHYENWAYLQCLSINRNSSKSLQNAVNWAALCFDLFIFLNRSQANCDLSHTTQQRRLQNFVYQWLTLRPYLSCSRS